MVKDAQLAGTSYLLLLVSSYTGVHFIVLPWFVLNIVHHILVLSFLHSYTLCSISCPWHTLTSVCITVLTGLRFPLICATSIFKMSLDCFSFYFLVLCYYTTYLSANVCFDQSIYLSYFYTHAPVVFCIHVFLSAQVQVLYSPLLLFLGTSERTGSCDSCLCRGRHSLETEVYNCTLCN